MMHGTTNIKLCKVLFQNKIYLWYCASDWFYCRNIFFTSNYYRHPI